MERRGRRIRGAAAAVGLLVIAPALAACEPTGSVRCDAIWEPIVVADAAGWSIDCTPDVVNKSGEGKTIAGWADDKTKTIYIWPDAIAGENPLRKIMWHEVGHAVGLEHPRNDVYAFCKMSPEQRLGAAWSPEEWKTTPAQCAAVGA